ncbi:MAG TPA: family 16 glycoside hydrolase, partial [Gemmataceae bacterium]|nr:family 16 glycoside hydrolase [Gemmataceae bacterium]
MYRSLLALLLIAAPAWADDDPSWAKIPYTPMWNGKDLAGWVNVNCHPSTFYVKDDMIRTSGHPTGFLRTAKQHENFIAEFDWMHQEKVKVGNSGFFVWADPIPAVGTGYTRGIEVQVLVNLTYRNKKGEKTATSQGDIFSIWGARCTPERPHPDGAERCLPSEDRTHGGGEWNHYRVVANDGTIRLEVNGKEVSSVHKCTPRKGYLALESEGAECWFKNLKIKELPSTNPDPKDVAGVDKGYKNLWYGLDFTNWKLEKGDEGHWRARDWILAYDGKSTAADKNLWTDKSYGNCELIVDWRLPGPAKKRDLPTLDKNGDIVKSGDGFPVTKEVMDSGNGGIFLR